jgi:hypothetical protein
MKRILIFIGIFFTSLTCLGLMTVAVTYLLATPHEFSTVDSSPCLLYTSPSPRDH